MNEHKVNLQPLLYEGLSRLEENVIETFLLGFEASMMSGERRSVLLWKR